MAKIEVLSAHVLWATSPEAELSFHFPASPLLSTSIGFEAIEKKEKLTIAASNIDVYSLKESFS